MTDDTIKINREMLREAYRRMHPAKFEFVNSETQLKKLETELFGPEVIVPRRAWAYIGDLRGAIIKWRTHPDNPPDPGDCCDTPGAWVEFIEVLKNGDE